MKKLIYFVFIIPLYISLLIDGILSRDIAMIIAMCYLSFSNTILINIQKPRTFHRFLFVFNSLLILPLILFYLTRDNISVFVYIVWILAGLLFLSLSFVQISKEFIFLFLMFFTLNFDVKMLYISVKDNMVSVLFFTEILHFLCFSINKSIKLFKFTKKNSRKKIVYD